MKLILTSLALVLCLNLAAQQNTTFAVSGNCGMCKSRIEKAAKEAGATKASWDDESKQLTVTYPSNVTLASIQQKIAAVGHDNAGAKASDDVYNKLHGCCKYDRNPTLEQKEETKESCCKPGETCKHEASASNGSCCGKPCCKDGKCANCGDCCKDGKCTKEGNCCKDMKAMSCCKDGKCTKEGNCSKDTKDKSCCKDGVCSKPGKDGKDCCKKS